MLITVYCPYQYFVSRGTHRAFVKFAMHPSASVFLCGRPDRLRYVLPVRSFVHPSVCRVRGTDSKKT